MFSKDMYKNHELKKAYSRLNDLERVANFVWHYFPDEEFREIEGTEGRYFISPNGTIISLCYTTIPYVLKPYPIKDYLYIKIDGKNRAVHILTAQTFLQNPEGKEVVHHRDSNKQNPKLENLQWATRSENTKFYYDSLKNKDAKSRE